MTWFVLIPDGYLPWCVECVQPDYWQLDGLKGADKEDPWSDSATIDFTTVSATSDPNSSLVCVEPAGSSGVLSQQNHRIIKACLVMEMIAASAKVLGTGFHRQLQHAM